MFPLRDGVLLTLLILIETAAAQDTFIRRYSGSAQYCGLGSVVTQQGIAGIAGSGFSFTGPTETLLGRIGSDGALTTFHTYGSGRFLSTMAVSSVPDGGFVVASNNFVESRGADAILLFRTTPSGGVRWKKSISSGTNDDAFAIAPVQGGFIVGGLTGNRATGDILLMKIDPAGKVLWSKAMAGSGVEFVLSLAVLRDGSFIAAGEKDSQPFLMRVDPNGNPLWMRLLSSAPFSPETTVQVAALPDGNFVVAVTLLSPTGSSIFLAKINSSGSRIWSKKYSSGTAVLLYDVAASTDGGVLVSGQLGSDAPRPLIFKVRENGSIQWKKVYSELAGSARTVSEFPDGSVLVSGCVDTVRQELFAMRLNSKGTLGTACSPLKSASLRAGGQGFSLQALSLNVTTSQLATSKPVLSPVSRSTTDTTVCSGN